MKNIPQKIYLQIGDECPNDADFKMLEGVTWCTEREFNNDIPFVLHKTECYTALELLQQMYNERTDLAKQGFESWQELQMNSDSENALLRVMRLIKERQANAV